MQLEEYLMGVKKIVINTLKERDVYTTFKKNHHRKVKNLHKNWSHIMRHDIPGHLDLNCGLGSINYTPTVDTAEVIASALDFSFIWSDTKEGAKFWRGISKEIHSRCDEYIVKNKKNVVPYGRN